MHHLGIGIAGLAILAILVIAWLIFDKGDYPYDDW